MEINRNCSESCIGAKAAAGAVLGQGLAAEWEKTHRTSNQCGSSSCEGGLSSCRNSTDADYTESSFYLGDKRQPGVGGVSRSRALV